ncbi:ras-related protein Rab-32B-like isoform X2 [Dysidea avara]|uniref:ras-related protein Rab-32B-like isoform X2 n=1 Tax=Dysidea avara TaxID=196820 RepID=UPI00332B305B
MASVQYIRRRPDPLSSHSVRSEHDLVIRDEANFSATQTLNEFQSNLLKLDPGRAKNYLHNQLRVNEARELDKGNGTRKDKMEYILTGTSCIKGKKGLDLILGLLHWLGSPTYAELADEMQLAYSKRMEKVTFPGPVEPEQPVFYRQQSAVRTEQVRREPIVQESEVVAGKLKIIVLGDHDVGKTSFIIRYCTGRFSTSETKPRISDEWMAKHVQYKGACYELHFWDTHGMEKHSSVPSVYYRDAVGLLLVYDVSQPKSQDSVKRWWKDASTTVMMKDGRPLPTVLLANKSDLQVITPDGTKLCEELQLCNWYKTSAKKGTGLNEAVECLVENY